MAFKGFGFWSMREPRDGIEGLGIDCLNTTFSFWGGLKF